MDIRQRTTSIVSSVSKTSLKATKLPRNSGFYVSGSLKHHAINFQYCSQLVNNSTGFTQSPHVRNRAFDSGGEKKHYEGSSLERSLLGCE
jgi:hypothetical protein